MSPSATIVAMDAAMQAAAKTRGIRFISPIQDGVTFTRADSTHPDSAGHRKLGKYLAGHIGTAYVAAP